MQELFRTVTGSRLYGLHSPDSDYDYFVVVPKVKTNRAKYATHKIKGEVDTVTVDLGTFVNGLRKGVPQYLEACFSQEASVDHLSALRNSYRFSTGVWDTYLRTIKSSAFQDSMKSKRHALRLALDMRDLRAYGRFNPRMAGTDITWTTILAECNDSDVVYEYALELAWSN